MSTPVLYAGTSYFAQKTQGEGLRFRPSPPSLSCFFARVWKEGSVGLPAEVPARRRVCHLSAYVDLRG